MRLKEIQENFLTSVVTGTPQDNLATEVLPCSTLAYQEAMNIYTNDYRARMTDAIGENFESTWLVLGDEDFFSASHSYIEKNPSRFPNLTVYGHRFPEFLAEAGHPPEVIQMAEFERCFWGLFHAPPKTALALDQKLLETGTFDLSQIGFFKSELRLDLVWENRTAEAEELENLELYGDCHLAVFKTGGAVEVKSLSPEAFELLREFKEVSRLLDLSPRELPPETWAEVLEVLMYAEIRF